MQRSQHTSTVNKICGTVRSHAQPNLNHKKTLQPHVVISPNRGTRCKFQRTIILIVETHRKVPLILRNCHVSYPKAWTLPQIQTLKPGKPKFALLPKSCTYTKEGYQQSLHSIPVASLKHPNPPRFIWYDYFSCPQGASNDSAACRQSAIDFQQPTAKL